MAETRYAKGKIYKLCSAADDKIFIGFTCVALFKRRTFHKAYAKRYQNFLLHTHFNNIGWDNVTISLIENYPCGDRMQLAKRCNEVVEMMRPALNDRAPTFSDLCEHEIQKWTCVPCRGSLICKHLKQRQNCYECDGSNTQKFQCGCGKILNKGGKTSHKKTKRHIEWMRTSPMHVVW
jgi:hypothetical protein